MFKIPSRSKSKGENKIDLPKLNTSINHINIPTQQIKPKILLNKIQPNKIQVD